MEVIFISGIFMSCFIVVLLLTKKDKALPDKILALLIAFIGIHLLGYYFKQTGYWEKYPHLIGLTAPVPLFHGPLLYLYCLYALRGAKKSVPSTIFILFQALQHIYICSSFSYFIRVRKK